MLKRISKYDTIEATYDDYECYKVGKYYQIDYLQYEELENLELYYKRLEDITEYLKQLKYIKYRYGLPEDLQFRLKETINRLYDIEVELQEFGIIEDDKYFALSYKGDLAIYEPSIENLAIISKDLKKFYFINMDVVVDDDKDYYHSNVTMFLLRNGKFVTKSFVMNYVDNYLSEYFDVEKYLRLELKVK